jgi:prepilin-type N-terminal cleavage/methylation domain-containing protein
MTTAKPFIRSVAGFSLLEIIVAVTIIGLLSAIAIPAYKKLNERSVNTVVSNELRIASGALQYYAIEKGTWPPDGAGGWPHELTGYLPPPDRWSLPTPIGGTWAWALNTEDAVASLRINNHLASVSQVTNLDKMVDDGDLTTGALLVSGSTLVYVLEK